MNDNRHTETEARSGKGLTIAIAGIVSRTRALAQRLVVRMLQALIAKPRWWYGLVLLLGVAMGLVLLVVLVEITFAKTIKKIVLLFSPEKNAVKRKNKKITFNNKN